MNGERARRQGGDGGARGGGDIDDNGDDAAISPKTRAALLRKYRLLAAWRRAKDRSFDENAATASGAEPLADRAALRAMAEEFPGALRELDRLGLAELERRAAVLTHETAAQNSGEPWIAWIAAYHELMRRVLAERRGDVAGRRCDTRKTKPGGGDHPVRVETSLAAAPEGRLSRAVLDEIARRFRILPADLGAALFPTRLRKPVAR